MGIEGRITAAPPEPDTRLVAHVLTRWKTHNPDQYKLAEFGLEHICGRIRCWAPELDDGLAIEVRWICFGCLFEFIYGFRDNEEQFIVTRLEAWDCDPCSDTITELGYAIFVPTAMRFERLPKMPDRTVNVRDRLGMGFAGAQGNRTEDVGAKHAVGRAVHQVLDLAVDALADHGIDTAASLLAGPAALQAAMVRGRTDGGFAPPWLPILYLRSHVPKRRVDLNVSNRRTSGKTMEIDMTKTNIVIITAVTRMLEHLETIDRTYDHNACAIVTNPDADILLPGTGIMLGGNTGRISAKDKARKACGTVIGDHAMIDLADDTDCTDDNRSFRVIRRHGRIGPDDAAAYIV